jgi:hypothetical protein
MGIITRAVKSVKNNVVPKGGLEPPRVAPYAPQTYVSTNSTTSARPKTLNYQTLCPGMTSGQGANQLNEHYLLAFGFAPAFG